MLHHEVFKRYSLILEKIQESNFPDPQDLIDYLERQGLKIYKRTLQRDLKKLKQDFDLNILYCRKKRGYYIPDRDRMQLDPFLKFIELVDTMELVSQSLAESRDTLKFISFESVEKSDGVKFLKPILKGLKERKILKLKYSQYSQAMEKDSEVLPYLLKQYMGRWYLVACYKGGKEKLYLFGLDRIVSLKVTANNFKPNPEINAQDRFKQIIGISDSGETPKRIVLSFKPEKAPYVKSLPLHSSQRIVFETDKECQIEIHVKINNELISKILSFGPSVKVLEPEPLVRKIKALIKENIALY